MGAAFGADLQSWVCELPFTQSAWSEWRSAQRLSTATTVLGAILSACGIVYAIAAGTLLDVAIGVPASLVLLVVLGLIARRQSRRAPGPACVTIGQENVVLDVPSETAAAAIALHLDRLRAGAVSRQPAPMALEGTEPCPRCRAPNRFKPGVLRICVRCGARDI
jgi:hypothetical protein